MPVAVDGHFLDTGGGNWFPYYSKMDSGSLVFPTDELESFREGDCYEGDLFEFLDHRTWLHTINGSCWKTIADGKFGYVHSYLDQMLGGAFEPAFDSEQH